MKEHGIIQELWEVINDRFENPKAGSYVTSLLTDPKGIDRVLEKVGEEATEFIIAVKNTDKERIISEAADVQFHLLVALKASGVTFQDLLAELESRRR